MPAPFFLCLEEEPSPAAKAERNPLSNALTNVEYLQIDRSTRCRERMLPIPWAMLPIPWAMLPVL